MAQRNWLDSDNLGIAGIDDQHQLLVGMVNELAGAMEEGESREILSRTLTGLAAYTVYHFATEEKLFNQHGYPEAVQHEEEHRGFIEKLNGFKSVFEAEGHPVPHENLSSLADWLVEHIRESDRRYATFLEDRGSGSSRVA